MKHANILVLTIPSSWKEAMENRIDQIEKSMVSSASASCPNDHNYSKFPVSSEAKGAKETSQSVARSFSKMSETSQEASLNLACSPGAFPASSLNSLVLKDNVVSFSSGGPNLVTRGLISQQTWEEHFNFYSENLNPYIHHLLTDDDTLGPGRGASIQERSSLLLAAICTVTAFCTGSDDFQTCFDAFMNEVSSKIFTNHHSFDDVRALCIGAFWLDNVSSALNALGESPIFTSLV